MNPSGVCSPTFPHQQGQVDGLLVGAGRHKEVGVEMLGEGRERHQVPQTDLGSERTGPWRGVEEQHAAPPCSTHQRGGLLGVPLYRHRPGQQVISSALPDDGGPGGGSLAQTPDQLPRLPQDSRLRQEVKTEVRTG